MPHLVEMKHTYRAQIGYTSRALPPHTSQNCLLLFPQADRGPAGDQPAAHRGTAATSCGAASGCRAHAAGVNPTLCASL